MLGVKHLDGSSLWFSTVRIPHENNYDGHGMNHFAFHTKTINDVDNAFEYLVSKGVPTLFETPRHRPEFCESPDEPTMVKECLTSYRARNRKISTSENTSRWPKRLSKDT